MKAADFARFDHILAMDRDNLRDLLAAAPPEHLPKIRLLRQHDPAGTGDVPDPYYGGPAGFDEVVTIVERSCRGLLAALAAGEDAAARRGNDGGGRGR